MQFLWKTQLRRERGKLLPRTRAEKSKTSRKEKLEVHTGKQSSYFLVVFLWVLLLGTLIYVAFFSPYLVIHDVKITGAPLDEKEAVDQFVHESLQGKYVWLFPKNEFFVVLPTYLEKRMYAAFPLIKTVEVKRVFPHGLEVGIEAREKLVVWCSGESCFHVLESGDVKERTAVFDKEENKKNTLTVRDTSEKPVSVGEEVFPSRFVPLVISLKDGFRNRLGIEIEDNFTTSSRFADEVRIKTQFGWEVYLDTEQPLEESLNALVLVLEKEIPEDKKSLLRYVDLRTENRVYYAFQEGVTIAIEEAVQTEDAAKMEAAQAEKKKEEKPKKEKD